MEHEYNIKNIIKYGTKVMAYSKLRSKGYTCEVYLNVGRSSTNGAEGGLLTIVVQTPFKDTFTPLIGLITKTRDGWLPKGQYYVNPGSHLVKVGRGLHNMGAGLLEHKKQVIFYSLNPTKKKIEDVLTKGFFLLDEPDYIKLFSTRNKWKHIIKSKGGQTFLLDPLPHFLELITEEAYLLGGLKKLEDLVKKSKEVFL